MALSKSKKLTVYKTRASRRWCRYQGRVTRNGRVLVMPASPRPGQRPETVLGKLASEIVRPDPEPTTPTTRRAA